MTCGSKRKPVVQPAPTTGVDFWAPFGGERDSSYGQREQGLTALDFYASTRTITLAPHP